MEDFDALWDYDNPAETEQKFQQLLPTATSEPGYHAELLTQIARCQGLQRQFQAAHRWLDEAEALLSDDHPRARVRYYLERGRALNSAGEPGQALKFFHQALELAEHHNQDFLAVDAAHMIAIADPPHAIDWNLKAVALAKDSQDPRARKWLGSLYNNLGWTTYDQEDYATALGFFENALEERQRQGAEDLVRIARWCIAKTQRALGRLEEALQIQRALHLEYEELGETDGYVFEEMGECLLALGKVKEAAAYFRQAHAVLSADAWLRENEPGRLERLAKLGSG